VVVVIIIIISSGETSEPLGQENIIISQVSLSPPEKKNMEENQRDGLWG
jgi:hypothetical protein